MLFSYAKNLFILLFDCVKGRSGKSARVYSVPVAVLTLKVIQGK